MKLIFELNLVDNIDVVTFVIDTETKTIEDLKTIEGSIYPSFKDGVNYEMFEQYVTDYINEKMPTVDKHQFFMQLGGNGNRGFQLVSVANPAINIPIRMNAPNESKNSKYELKYYVKLSLGIDIASFVVDIKSEKINDLNVEDQESLNLILKKALNYKSLEEFMSLYINKKVPLKFSLQFLIDFKAINGFEFISACQPTLVIDVDRIKS